MHHVFALAVCTRKSRARHLSRTAETRRRLTLLRSFARKLLVPACRDVRLRVGCAFNRQFFYCRRFVH
jgi:hypothetical protein